MTAEKRTPKCEDANRQMETEIYSSACEDGGSHPGVAATEVEPTHIGGLLSRMSLRQLR